MNIPVYLESDIYKPLDYEGNVRTPTYKSLEFGEYGQYARVSIGGQFEFTDNGNTFVFGVLCQFISLWVKEKPNYVSGWKLNLKCVVEISVDDFQTISQRVEEISEADWYPAENVPAYSRTLPYGTPGQHKGFSYRGYNGYYVYKSVRPIITLNIQKTTFKYRVRCYYQNANSSWVEAGVSNAYSAYAPYVLNITKPSHFYMNGLNTFGAVIDAEYTSNIKWKIDGISTSVTAMSEMQEGLYNRPVRTVASPYPKTGLRTEEIYWYPGGGYKVGDDGGPCTQYTMDVTLDIEDPENRNYRSIVATNTITGDIEYLDETDLSPFTWSISYYDPEGNYERYGYLLRNTKSTLVWRLQYEARYGAYLRAELTKFNGERIEALALTSGSGVIEITQAIPKTGTSVTTSFMLYHRTTGLLYSGFTNVLDYQSVTIPIHDYSVPAFTNLAVHRCNENGEPNDNGAYCKIDWSVTVNPIENMNSKVLTIVQPAGVTEYDPLDYYVQYGTLIVPASTERAFTIKFTLTDDLSEIVRTMRLSTAGVIMDWMNRGRGVSFGKVATTRSAVEVSPDWKLICYYLLLNGIDVATWMTEVDIRLKGIEEYTTNFDNPGQYQVTFYNDNVMWDRQWIKTGENAEEPNGTPERAPTRQYSYSFAGWALTKGATSSDVNALKNITSYRRIYAAYQQTTRVYKVEFYNGETLLETDDNVTYGTSTTCSVTPTGSGTFFGFIPNPTFVDKNMDCVAQFYTRSEIADDWNTIIAKCQNRTAGEEYLVGQYKPLTLSNNTTINMRLMGIRRDTVSGLDKAELTWISESSIGSKKMNETSSIVPIYQYLNSKGFTRSDYFNYGYSYTTEPRLYGPAKLTLYVKISGYESNAGLYIRTMNGNGRKIKVYVNGSVVIDSSNSGNDQYINTTYYTPEYPPDTEFTVVVETDVIESGTITQRADIITIYAESSPEHGISMQYVKLSETYDTAKVRYIKRYENGTGAVGGWEHMDLRQYLNDSILPLIPDNVRENIRFVEKTAAAALSTVMDEKTYEDATVYIDDATVSDAIWVPSITELFGPIREGQEECAEYGKAGSNYPLNSYTRWLRDSYSSTKGYTVAYTSPGDTSVSYSGSVIIGFCT